MKYIHRCFAVLILCPLAMVVAADKAPARAPETPKKNPNTNVAAPHPAKNPGSRIMLKGDWVPANPHQIDFSKLPKIPLEHAVVSEVRAQGGVNQHNYLIHHDGRFWAMWSDGPRIEDR